FLMYYLVDTSIENGCLRVIEGSHRKRHPIHDAVHTTHSEELGRAADPYNPAYQPVPEDKAVPVRAGDLVIGDARLLHGSFSNRTEERRTVITLWYHPNFEISPPPIQSSVSREQTHVSSWPPQARKLVQKLVPTYEGDAEPLERKRVPGPELK
ncbi:MAG: phytanoyl-CoA dioxygenase family protein, partial [Caldilineaceae bacterium]|nr:phytanoyl-CoA dioxygenase family protein [Caldilineaceae bacterium]